MKKMKKLFTLLTVMMLGLATFTQAVAFNYQDTTKKTKSGKLDKRYNANKHLKKNGTMDMRYNSSKKAASKVQTEKKKPVTP
jgi:carbonic anhydrase